MEKKKRKKERNKRTHNRMKEVKSWVWVSTQEHKHTYAIIQPQWMCPCAHNGHDCWVKKIKWTMIINACVNFLGVNVSLFHIHFCCCCCCCCFKCVFDSVCFTAHMSCFSYGHLHLLAPVLWQYESKYVPDNLFL